VSEDAWPFDQPHSCASISLRSIVHEGAPILHVTHDSDDHGWQFLGLEHPSESDACVIALEEAIALDSTLLQLADLPPGWHAWRLTPASPWRRAPTLPEAVRMGQQA
jgi:hypothetical protein